MTGVASSASDRLISIGGLESVDEELLEGGGIVADRCTHLSRTPSTALKKLVDPDANVRDIASRVGASDSSKCRSYNLRNRNCFKIKTSVFF